MDYNKDFNNWRASVRFQLFRRGMTIKELAAATGYAYKYLCGVLNFTHDSQVAVDRISVYLEIPAYQYSEIDRREIRVKKGGA